MSLNFEKRSLLPIDEIEVTIFRRDLQKYLHNVSLCQGTYKIGYGENLKSLYFTCCALKNQNIA